MKVVFAHDHKILTHKNNYYSNGSFSSEVLERYTNVFDKVVFLSRQQELEELDIGLTLSNSEKVEFVKIPNLNSIKSIFKRKNANKILEENIKKADCVIARLPSIIGRLSIKYAKKNNKPYLVEVVGCPYDAYKHHGKRLGRLIAPVEFFLQKFYVRDAKFVLYVTKEFLQKRYPTKGKSINCSNVSLYNVNSNILDKRLKKIKSYRDDTILKVGTIGNLAVKYKGQHYVIEALSKLKNEGYKFEYHIVGGGDAKHLIELAKTNSFEKELNIVGSLTHNEIFNYLDELDIYIQPSETEGLPRALIEAMSRGCPSIGSNVGGIPELLKEKYIFKSGSVSELENILKKTNKESMLENSKHSFKTSENYEKKILDRRREQFFREFKKSIK